MVTIVDLALRMYLNYIHSFSARKVNQYIEAYILPVHTVLLMLLSCPSGLSCLSCLSCHSGGIF